MKLLILYLIVGLITASVTYAAGPAAVTAKNIRQKLSDVVYGDMNQNNLPADGIVVVMFSVNDDGKIDIKKIQSTDTDAENFVVKKINSLSCKDNVYPYHHLYRVKFQFDRN